MSIKDYQLISYALAESTLQVQSPEQEDMRCKVAFILARELQDENPRFDWTRFLRACKVDEPRIKEHCEF